MTGPTVNGFATGRRNTTVEPSARQGAVAASPQPASTAAAIPPSTKRTTASTKSKNTKKTAVLIAMVLLLVGGVGYQKFKPTKAAPPQPGDVVALDANTLNLTRGHYLKIAISIQLVKGKASAANFSTSKAAELTIEEFSDRPIQSLSTNAKRNKLSAQLTNKIEAAYRGQVYDVYVTQFVTQ